MKDRRKQITVSYRVLDASGHTVDIFKMAGFNKNNLLWKAERLMKNKYGKGMKLHQFKVVEEKIDNSK